MSQYMNAEFYRISHKRNLYIFFAVLTILYPLAMFVRAGTMGQGDMPAEAGSMNSILLIFGGGYLFASIFNDDFAAKSVVSLLGYGVKRSTIELTKMTVFVAFNTLMIAVASGLFCLLVSMMGFKVDQAVSTAIFQNGLETILLVTAYGGIASIVGCATQRATATMVTYVLLTVGIVDSFVGLFLQSMLPQSMGVEFSGYMVLGICNKIVFDSSLVALAEYGIYITVFLAIAILAFNKKEIEV